ncbi:MAG TPA: hypothetical protein PLG90_01875 [Ignavibacteria bacterium]|nr:hypothetical protein [Ignavibacteria bacterium]
MKKNLFLILLISSFFIGGKLFAQKVVYTSTDNPTGYLQVFTMNIDGSDKKQLTALNQNAMYPRWSYDGTKIVFYTDNQDIYLISDLEGISNPYFVFKGYNVCFTWDDNNVIFVAEHEGFTTLYIMEPTEPSPTPLSGDDYSTMQVLAADGRTMVYSAFEGGDKDIFITDLSDSTAVDGVRLTKNNDSELEPDISPDGSLITYASFDMNLKGTIYVYKDNKEIPLTQGMSSTNQPKFSPDNKLIAFVLITDNSVDLYTMNTDGSNKKKISTVGGSVGNFRWVDASNIIYDVEIGNANQIGLVNVYNNEVKFLTSRGTNAFPDITK